MYNEDQEHYILVQSGNDEYRYPHNEVVKVQGPITIIRCPSRYLAKYQLGRYMSGLCSASHEVYTSLEAAERYVELHSTYFLR